MRELRLEYWSRTVNNKDHSVAGPQEEYRILEKRMHEDRLEVSVLVMDLSRAEPIAESLVDEHRSDYRRIRVSLYRPESSSVSQMYEWTEDEGLVCRFPS